MLKNQLLKLAQYNLWANSTLLDWMIKAGEELADAKCESSFPTLRKTIYHIYDAEFGQRIARHQTRRPNDKIEYPNAKGVLFSNTIADIINHVINHGTYHRGQLITMMRTLGYTDLGATDYIAYCRL